MDGSNRFALDGSLKCQMRIKTLPSPASSSGRPSRTYVERKTLASGIFAGVHVNHLYGLWLGSRNERIVVQQQNRFDYPHELTARHRFWHGDRYGQGIRLKAAIPYQGITSAVRIPEGSCQCSH